MKAWQHSKQKFANSFMPLHPTASWETALDSFCEKCTTFHKNYLEQFLRNTGYRNYAELVKITPSIRSTVILLIPSINLRSSSRHKPGSNLLCPVIFYRTHLSASYTIVEILETYASYPNRRRLFFCIVFLGFTFNVLPLILHSFPKVPCRPFWWPV